MVVSCPTKCLSKHGTVYIIDWNISDEVTLNYGELTEAQTCFSWINKIFNIVIMLFDWITGFPEKLTLDIHVLLIRERSFTTLPVCKLLWVWSSEGECLLHEDPASHTTSHFPESIRNVWNWEIHSSRRCLLRPSTFACD